MKLLGLFAALIALAPSSFAQPKRIVSTAPSITEILFALGLGDRVVGVTTFCRYPAEALSRPKIGTYYEPNFEAILAARPDVVFVVKNPVRFKEKLEGMGLRVVELAGENLAGITESIRLVAATAGVPERAVKLNASIAAELASIRKSVEGRSRPKFLFVIGRTPGRLEGLFVAGRDNFLNELIGIAGGANAFADLAQSYAKVPLEEVLARNPEVVLDIGDMADTASVTPEKTRATVALWSAVPSIPAVKNGRVHATPADYFFVAGPRVVEAARAFVRLLHPEIAR